MVAESPKPDGTPLPKAQRTRLRLVQAVRDEIEATGAFTADLAARRAGSATATFYNHLPSKEAALEAVYVELMDELVEAVARLLRIERVLEVGLEAFVGEWVLGVASFFRRNARVFSAAQVALPDSKAMRDVFRDREAAALETYARFVQLGQAARVVRAGDVAAMAQVMMVTSEGWLHPSVQTIEAGDAFHTELTDAVVRMLAPDEEGNE
ncbi:MAG: TetR/AcrR family transcriptional regulator [Myxococcota bacterium]